MNKNFQFAIQIILNLIGLGFLFLIYMNIPALRTIEYNLTGWGLVVLIPVTLAVSLANVGIKKLLAFLMRGQALVPPAPVRTFISDVADCAQFTVILVVAGMVAPGLVSYSAVGPILVFTALIGVVDSLSRSLASRIAAKYN